MKRRHLFEFHERSQCPAFIRESIVEALGTGLHWGGLASIIGPSFASFCDQAQPKRVLELCSGSGRLVPDLARSRAASGISTPAYILSDLFPEQLATCGAQQVLPDSVQVCASAIDATLVEAQPSHDARMLINSFHHFTPDQARTILRDCVVNKKSVFIFEGMHRGWWSLIMLALSLPAVPLALFVNPFVATKHKLLKAVFTYLIPIIPAVLVWDSVISNLRCYDRDELMDLVSEMPGYLWTYREVRFGRGSRATAFFGVAQESTHHAPSS